MWGASQFAVLNSEGRLYTAADTFEILTATFLGVHHPLETTTVAFDLIVLH
jgi:hypothetical protein